MMDDDEDVSHELRRALGEAYVKVGTQHLDLTMVIKGKNRLKEADDASPQDRHR